MGSTSSKTELLNILNKAIVVERNDAQYLRDLLNIKLSIAGSDPEKKLSFDPTFIFAQNDLDVDLVIDILDKASQVCSNFMSHFQFISDYVNSHSSTTNNNQQLKLVKILHFMISFYIKENLQTDKKILLLFTDILIKCLNNAKTKILAYKSLNSIFSRITKLGQIICINNLYNFCKNNRNLDTFCGLLMQVPEELFYDVSCCLKQADFWSFIESCISGSESSLQKQGIYVLHKYVSVTTSHNTVKSSFVSISAEEAWQAFFVLIDVGREKQLHLIAPALPLFKHIPQLPDLWQTCCYKIYLKHSQSSVIYQVADKMLKRQFTGVFLKDMMKLVLPALNRNEYNNQSCEVFTTFEVFCLNLSLEDLQIVIKEITQIAWNPMSFWKVVQNVFPQKRKKVDISLELCHEILGCALQLPHLHIRDQCVMHIISTIWDENECDKVIQIAQTLNEAGLDPLKYLKDLKFSNKVVSHAIESKYVVTSSRIGSSIPMTNIILILKCANINTWTFMKDTINSLDCQSRLYIWRDYLLTHDFKSGKCDTLDRQIGDFLVNYFTKDLCSYGVEYFIELFKLFAAKSNMPSKVYKLDIIIDKPLTYPDSYNQHQIFVALVLVQDYLFKEKGTQFVNQPSSKNDLFVGSEIDRIDFDILASNQVSIKIMTKNGNQSRIVAKDPRICIECVHLLFLINKKNFSGKATENALAMFTTFLESQSNCVLKCVYAKTFDLLHSTDSPLVVNNFILLLHKNLMQIKRDQYYKNIVSEFIKIVFSETFCKFNIKHKNNSIHDDIINICHMYPVLRLNCLKAMRNLISSTDNFYNICLKVVVDLYLQGTVINKDERNEFSLCQEIADFLLLREDKFTFDEASNPNLLNAVSRLLALDALTYIGQKRAGLVSAINFLKERYAETFKKRYFIDSRIHYEKLRILQALLVLLFQCQLSHLQSQQLSAFALDCFEAESNQNCVKQILNWILILTLKDVKPIISWINAKGNDVSPTLLINIIPTLFHLSTMANEDTLHQTLNLALPWTMGAHFKLRVYAQDFVKRLINHGKEKGYQGFIQKCEYLENSISNCISASGDNFNNALKTDLILLNDFDPIREISWSAALCDISRLNKVHASEWQNLQAFISKPDLLEVELLTQNVLLAPRSPAFNLAIDTFLTVHKSTPNGTEENVAAIAEISHIQKKIAPWKSALENFQVDAKPSDFILIASLIEKAQNLGGLSRTCEIFGVKDIVFANANVVTEKEFKSLSMASEAWINAIEVKETDLTDYIGSLQKEGYCVIGAEQTAGSLKLNNFAFPKKVALVLGNEKTGIPPGIIPLMDKCLEIPQLGQTRSLNVHVAGATFIWEYAKQHLV